jgi:hypothetical protein
MHRIIGYLMQREHLGYFVWDGTYGGEGIRNKIELCRHILLN